MIVTLPQPNLQHNSSAVLSNINLNSSSEMKQRLAAVGIQRGTTWLVTDFEYPLDRTGRFTYMLQIDDQAKVWRDSERTANPCAELLSLELAIQERRTEQLFTEAETLAMGIQSQPLPF